MLRQAFIILALLMIGYCVQAQDFAIPVPKKKKDQFAHAIIRLLNDAPVNFKNVKDKVPKKPDTEYPGTPTFECKVKIPGATKGKLVQDIGLFADYTFGEYSDIKTAQAAYVHFANSIGDALNEKILYDVDTVGKGNIVREIKLAYTLPSGFFHYNMLVQLCKNDDNDSMRLKFKVRSGKPQFYYKINRNEPINSFMFVSAVRGNLNNFHKLVDDKNCLGEIPTFICRGLKKQSDTSIITYTKSGFQYQPDAIKEFEANLNNLRSCLSEEYVYYIIPPEGNRLRQVGFLKFDDVDDIKRKVMQLALVEISKSEYILEMRFVW